jgi:hypothetical protein
MTPAVATVTTLIATTNQPGNGQEKKVHFLWEEREEDDSELR